jgi:hypothetical protein
MRGYCEEVFTPHCLREDFQILPLLLPSKSIDGPMPLMNQGDNHKFRHFVIYLLL